MQPKQEEIPSGVCAGRGSPHPTAPSEDSLCRFSVLSCPYYHSVHRCQTSGFRMGGGERGKSKMPLQW